MTYYDYVIDEHMTQLASTTGIPHVTAYRDSTEYGPEFDLTISIDRLKTLPRCSSGQRNLRAVILGYYPEKIIHNGPVTIVFWPDKTKTVVKCSENDIYDPFDAFTAALAKKIYGTTSSVKTMLKKVTIEQKPKKKNVPSYDSPKSALDALTKQADTAVETLKEELIELFRDDPSIW